MSKYTVMFEVVFEVEAEEESKAATEADRLFGLWIKSAPDAVEPSDIEMADICEVDD